MKVVMLGQYPIDKSYISGGVETAVMGMAIELAKIPHIDLHIVSCTPLINKDLIVNEMGYTVHYLSSPKLPRILTTLSIDSIKVIRKIKQLNPDIIHAHMTAPLYGYPALKCEYPTIVTVHGIVEEESRHWHGIHGNLYSIIYNPMERYVFKNAKNITVVSNYVRNKIESKCKGKITVIPNGINPDFFSIENNEIEYRLLCVGGIEPRKDLLSLLKAIELVRKHIPHVKLHIVGRVRKKMYYDSLIKYIKENDLSENIIFKHEINNESLRKEFSECSIFVFPSLEESFGIVLAEAGASGKPVVASNIGGIPDVVDDNKTGFLIKDNNDEDFAEKILILLNDKDLRHRMGTAGKEKASEFLNERIAEMFNDLYKEVARK